MTGTLFQSRRIDPQEFRGWLKGWGKDEWGNVKVTGTSGVPEPCTIR